MKKQTKLTKKQLLLKKQKQKHYITAALLSLAIVLVGVFFYTLKPSSTVQIEITFPQSSDTAQNETIPSVAVVNVTAICTNSPFNLINVSVPFITEYNGSYLSRLEFTANAPPGYNVRNVVIEFNTTIESISLYRNGTAALVNGEDPGAEDLIWRGNTLEIWHTSAEWQVVVTFPVPSWRDEE